MNFEKPQAMHPRQEKKKPTHPESEWKSMEEFSDWRSSLIDDETLKKTDPVAFEKVKEQFKRENFQVGKLDVQLFGLEHSRETLALYRAQLEEAIKLADIVLTEAPFEASGDFDKIWRKARSNGERTNLDNGNIFFLEVDRMVAKHGKTLISVDPQYEAEEKTKEGKTASSVMGELDRNIDRYQTIGTIGTTVVAGGYAALKTSGTLHATVEGLNEGQMPDLGVTRRNLLKAAGAGVVSYGAAKMGIENADVHSMRGDGANGRDYIYALHDYRDAVAAQALRALGQSFTKPMKVVVIYGRAHKEGIQTYALDPKRLQSKLTAYKPFRNISPPAMSVYKFEKYPVPQRDQQFHIPVFGEWKKKSKSKLPPIEDIK